MTTTAAFLEAVHADPWSEEFVDLPALNANVSAAIEEAVNKQRAAARARPETLRCQSIVVLGPPGAGKTHLFVRLRRRLGPKAVFVHVRPLLNSEMTPRFVLHEVVKQLGYSTKGLRQVGALVGSLLAQVAGAGSSFPTAFLEECGRLEPGAREARLDEALETVLTQWPETDESYLRLLLGVPFAAPSTQRAMLTWLSGRECDSVQLSRVGATAGLPEEAVIPALKTLSAVASLGAPIVIVFDQLENLIDAGGLSSRLAAYANLSMELVDSLRGLVLVHMALDSEWQRGIEPALTLAQRSRIALRQELLALPNATQREELLQMWVEKVPEPLAPFPWPLGEKRVARLCSQPGMTPRMLLVECRQAVERGPELETEEAPAEEAAELHGVLALEWEQQLQAARAAVDEAAAERQCVDAARLVDGLAVAASFASGLSLESTRMKDAAQLTWSTRSGKLCMAYLNQSHHRSVTAALKRLTQLAVSERLLVVRDRAQELPPSWKETLSKRAALLEQANARWSALEREDAVRLLALDSFVQAARSGDVTDGRGRPIALDAVRAWIAAELAVDDWPIVAGLQGHTEAAAEEVPSPSGASASGAVWGVLARLRVASLDRLVREVSRVDANATRATVQAELERHAAQVRWFGRAIVCVRAVP